MKNIFALIILNCIVFQHSLAQEESPYRTGLVKDGLAITAGVGLSVWGLDKIKNKAGLTEDQVNSKLKSEVNWFDRSSAGNYSERLDKISYYPFYVSFAMPVAMMFTNKTSAHTGQIITMYVETMAVTSALFTMAAGNVQRSRPLVYSSDAPMELRRDNDSQRSFFAGHTAATAAATFYAAKVYQDFHPGSRATPYIWTAAAVVPAVVGYLRLESGKHFLSDNLIGYAIGAGTGILIPQLHKKSDHSNLSMSSIYMPGFKGVSLTYTY